MIWKESRKLRWYRYYCRELMCCVGAALLSLRLFVYYWLCLMLWYMHRADVKKERSGLALCVSFRWRLAPRCSESQVSYSSAVCWHVLQTDRFESRVLICDSRVRAHISSAGGRIVDRYPLLSSIIATTD